MSNQELIEQFKRCQSWQDPEQWKILAILYWSRGYELNARRCLDLADACRVTAVTAEVS